jgi:hypothetical protein
MAVSAAVLVSLAFFLPRAYSGCRPLTSIRKEVVGRTLPQLILPIMVVNSLWILAVSALPLSLNHVYFTMRRVEKKMKSVIWLTGFMAVSTPGLSYVLLPVMGIKGAGIAASACWKTGCPTATSGQLGLFWKNSFFKVRTRAVYINYPGNLEYHERH